MRGFSKSRIQTQVDGIPIYTDRRAGNSVSFLSANMLSGIDIVQGPSSTLYGSDAVGGVINLKTIDFNASAFSSSVQSNGQQKELLLAVGDDSWQSALNYRHGNNGENANKQPLAIAYEQLTFLQKYQSQWQDIELKFTWLPSYGQDIAKSSAQYPQERITNYPSEIHSLSQIELTKAKQWYAKLYHHYQNWDTDILRPENRRNVTEYQSHTLGGSWLTQTQLLGAESRLGIDWVNRQGVSIKESEFDLNEQLNFQQQVVDGQQHNIALFSDFHWQLEQIGFAAGLRYDYISQRQFIEQEQRSETKLNASLLANWQPSEHIEWQIEFATGFRFPTLTELYFEGETPRGTTLGNDDLLPESSKGLQLALDWQFNDSLKLHGASYFYQQEDYIERYNVTEEVRSYRNLDKATLYGAELSIQWQQTDKFSHQVMAQWQHGEDDAGNTLADIQAPELSWQLTWQKDSWQVENSLDYRFAKSDFAEGEQYLSSFLNWQLIVSKEINQQTTISLWAENLLNRIAPTTADEYAPDELGRNLGLKLHYLFD